MSTRTNHAATNSNTETTVFGQADTRTLAAIDQIADQMLMPRSWVVSQILQQWAENRSAEIDALEQSWNGSVREAAGELAPTA